ncbi:MAG: L,D-transpeptidase [Rhizobiaceae bacterium]|nr:L,D-transpeptidase [Rhizobiaceae bacterium]
MKKNALLLLSAALIVMPVSQSVANDRYSTPKPLTLSPDLTSPWLLQLRNAPKIKKTRIKQQHTTKKQRRLVRQEHQQSRGTGLFAAFRNSQPQQRAERNQRQVAYSRVQRQQFSTQTATAHIQSQAAQRPIDPQFLPRTINYESSHKPGTILINTQTRHLYLILGDGKARRYGVGVGKQGFEWSGSEKITRKAEWPSWRPPAEMIAREREKGRELPTFMEGGPANPMGARALYLGSTLYRIHGTNQPWTIGQAVSSGCIRMRNEDVMDLYERARIGAKVIVS